MRILIITQWCAPEPGLKSLLFAKGLLARGHEVTILTGFPNYPEGVLYPGYKLKLFQRETIEGVKIIRVPLYPNHDDSPVKRVINYTSFALSASALGPFLVGKVDIIYVHSPPATTGLPAIVLSSLKGVPFVYDVQDLWPDTLSSTGMLNNRFILKLIGLWCGVVYRFASRVVVLSEGFRKRMLDRGVPEGKVRIIYNWCDTKSVATGKHDPILKKELGMDGKFNLLFAGNIGKAQALDAVLLAAAQVADLNSNILFTFIGGGVDLKRIKQLASDMGLTNVNFLPRVPVSEVGKFLGLADALLVHLKDDPLFAITIPSKTQAYMAVGKPILMAVRGNAAELVERAGAGVVCEPENPENIAASILKMSLMPSDELAEMGIRGKTFYMNELSTPVGVKHFESIFNELVK